MTPFRLFEYFLSISAGVVTLGIAILIVGILLIVIRGALTSRG